MLEKDRVGAHRTQRVEILRQKEHTHDILRRSAFDLIGKLLNTRLESFDNSLALTGDTKT